MDNMDNVDTRHYKHLLKRTKDNVWRFGNEITDINESTNLENWMRGTLSLSLFIRYTRTYVKDMREKQVALAIMGLDIDIDNIKKHVEIFKKLEESD